MIEILSKFYRNFTETTETQNIQNAKKMQKNA